jgi:hypothetical protein
VGFTPSHLIFFSRQRLQAPPLVNRGGSGGSSAWKLSTGTCGALVFFVDALLVPDVSDMPFAMRFFGAFLDDVGILVSAPLDVSTAASLSTIFLGLPRFRGTPSLGFGARVLFLTLGARG